MKSSFFVNFSFIFLLFFCHRVTHSQQMLDSLRLELSKAEGSQEVQVLNVLSEYLQHSDPEESLKIALKSVRIAEEINYREGRVKALCILATYHSKRHEFHKTDSLINIADPLAQELKDDQIIATVILSKGVLSLRKGRYPEALKIHLKGKKLASKSGDKDLQINYLTNIALIKQRIGNFKEADRGYKKALEIAQTMGLKERSGQLYGNLGVLEFQKNNIGLAIDYIQKSYEIYQDSDNFFLAAKSLNNLGFAYEKLGETNKALNFYDRSLTLRKKIGDKRGEAVVLLNKAKILKLTEPKKAEELALHSMAISMEIKNYSILRDAYVFLKDFYISHENYKKAVGIYSKLTVIEDTLKTRANVIKVNNIIDQNRYTELRSLNERIQTELSSKNLLFLITSFSMIVLLILTFLFFKLRIEKLKKRSIKSMIFEKKQSQYRFESLGKEKTELLHKIKNLQVENELLNKKQLDVENNHYDQVLLIKHMKESIVDKKDWLSYVLHFEVLYPNFFKKLEEISQSELTIKEQRLASLIKINISNKEISDILGISSSSVLKAKSRLKVKLKLNSIKEMERTTRMI
ncbi:MAG: transcriptional regulator [Nonlabens sp.]